MRTSIIVASALIVAGMLMLSIPHLSAWYYDRQQQQLIEQWHAAFTAVEISTSAEEKSSSFYLTELQPDISSVDDPDVPEREPARLDTGMEGMLLIDKIELQLPILTGATEQNLKTSAASIEDTGKPGEVGNYAIAGHRNLEYGRNFNRLDELIAGDFIEVDTGESMYRYSVTEKLYVEPHEVWVLEPEGNRKEITLVTCHPIETGTHRLIIKGTLIES